VGRSGEEVRRKAAIGDLADATTRLDTCGGDTELIAFIKKCLEPEAMDRPKDAQAVTDGLSAYINGVQERSQTAERELAVAVAREAEQRKKRKVQLALAGMVGLLMLCGGAFAFWQVEQAQVGRERNARNAEAVTALMGQCKEALLAEDASKAALSLDAAKKRSAEGGAENLAEQLKQLDADLTLLNELDSIGRSYWNGSDHTRQAAKLKSQMREALVRFGVDPDAVPFDDTVVRVSTSTIRERIVLALDRLLIPERIWDWDILRLRRPTLYTRQMQEELESQFPQAVGVLSLLKRVDADPFRDAVRDAIVANDRARVLQLVNQEESLQQPATFVEFLGESSAIEGPRKRQLMQAALRQRPDKLELLMLLGWSYPEATEPGATPDATEQQMRWFQAAVAAAPDNAWAHLSLGIVLVKKEKHDEAIASYGKAHELDPKFVQPVRNLTRVLILLGRYDEALIWANKLIEISPMHGYNILGTLLSTQGKTDEAIDYWKKALELEPSRPNLELLSLGQALSAKGQYDEAIAVINKYIELAPNDGLGHEFIGAAFGRMGRFEESLASLKKSIELVPKPNARAHLSLGAALRNNGRFEESLTSLRKSIELDPNNAVAQTYLARSERDARLTSTVQDKFADFLSGSYTPASNDERLGLVILCRFKKLWHAAAGLSADAFASDPKLADELEESYRYNAACYAALASAGQGEDAAGLDDKERTRLRRQAYDWLRAELAAYNSQLKNGAPTDQKVRRTLGHWQQDTDLASIRDAEALGKLPESQQKAFNQLWSDVTELLKKANVKPE